MHISMIGTRGVPAAYGGFETAVEEIGQRLVSRGHQVTVYCRNDALDGARRRDYLGMDLVHLPSVHRKSLETITHTSLSVAHAALLAKPDVAFVFNAANSPQAQLLRAMRIPYAIHVDGIEWMRSKWGVAGRTWYKACERIAARTSHLIADSQGIADYFRERFDVSSHLIAYGAPTTVAGRDRLAEVGLKTGEYALVVARLEPENNVHLILEGYRKLHPSLPLIVVGSAPYANDYIRELHAHADASVNFLGSVYDQTLLDQLYSNAFCYLHGHSVGGTNPSLLRAAGAGTPTLALDTVFNREVLEGHGRFWRNPQQLADKLQELIHLPPEIRIQIGVEAARSVKSRYSWDRVAMEYEDLAELLIRSRPGVST